MNLWHRVFGRAHSFGIYLGVLPALTSLSTATASPGEGGDQVGAHSLTPAIQLDLVETIGRLLVHSQNNQKEFRAIGGYPLPHSVQHSGFSIFPHFPSLLSSFDRVTPYSLYFSRE